MQAPRAKESKERTAVICSAGEGRSGQAQAGRAGGLGWWSLQNRSRGDQLIVLTPHLGHHPRRLFYP